MSNDYKQAVLNAEQQRCAAMLSGDNEALDALLNAELQFSHATGAVDDKSAYMAKMAAGRIAYVGIEWSEQKVAPLGDSHAMLTGRMTTDVRVEGVDKRLNNRVMTIWTQTGGNWEMLAFQSTPMAG
jgi:hypothetical protein